MVGGHVGAHKRENMWMEDIGCAQKRQPVEQVAWFRELQEKTVVEGGRIRHTYVYLIQDQTHIRTPNTGSDTHTDN